MQGLLPFLGVLAVMGILQHPFCSKASSVLFYLRLDLTEGKAQPGDVQGRVWLFVKIVSRDGLSLAGWDQQGFPRITCLVRVLSFSETWEIDSPLILKSNYPGKQKGSLAEPEHSIF